MAGSLPHVQELELTRLNGDSSWLVTQGAQAWAIDPWLTGAEIDCCAAFNVATLREPAVPPALLAVTAILLTQGFSDHCHEETLLALGKGCPIYAVPAALARLQRGPPQLRARAQPLASAAPAHPGWRAQHLPPPLLAPTHGGVLLATPGGSVLIAPHGLEAAALPAAARLCAAAPRPLAVLATTSTFALPWYVGGTVNLGLQRAAALCAAVRADAFHATHDEDKMASGWVVGAAQRRYCRAEEVRAAIPAHREARWHAVLLQQQQQQQRQQRQAPPPVRRTLYPPPPQLPPGEGALEAPASAAELRALAEGAAGVDPAADCVRVTRAWNAAAATYTFHAHAFVAGVGGRGRALLQQASELFFRAYELKQHGWYRAFRSGASTAPVAPAAELGGELEGCEGEYTQGYGVFDLGLGRPRVYHTLFTRTQSVEEGWACVVLRTVTPPQASQPPVPGAVQVFLLPPTGDYFVLKDGGLHWHHICTVAGVGLLPGALDGLFMNTLRACGGDGQERTAYREESQAFVRYMRSLLAGGGEEGTGKEAQVIL